MNIIVVNFSGNVGKSSLVRHLLAPRLPDHVVVEVETVNLSGNSGVDVIRGSGSGASSLLDEMTSDKNHILDIGSSNAEPFLSVLSQRKSFLDVDLFIVPVLAGPKQIGDTINSVLALVHMGVEEQNILILPNNVREFDVDELPTKLSRLSNLKLKYSSIRFDPNFFVPYNESVEILMRAKDVTGGRALTVSDAATDSTDYRLLIAESEDREKRRELTKNLVLQRMAVDYKKVLDRIFDEIFGATVGK